MRSPVYRNLDKPFQILGFNPPELIALSTVFIFLGELCDTVSLNRIWALFLTLVLAFGMHWFRKALGDLFGRRLIRFLWLPTELAPRLFISGRSIK